KSRSRRGSRERHSHHLQPGLFAACGSCWNWALWFPARLPCSNRWPLPELASLGLRSPSVRVTAAISASRSPWLSPPSVRPRHRHSPPNPAGPLPASAQLLEETRDGPPLPRAQQPVLPEE